jgi:serine/threonine protein kinase
MQRGLDFNIVSQDNVLVDENGRIQLTDFGLAIMRKQAVRFSETDPGGGTIRWMVS